MIEETTCIPDNLHIKECRMVDKCCRCFHRKGHVFVCQYACKNSGFVVSTNMTWTTAAAHAVAIQAPPLPRASVTKARSTGDDCNTDIDECDSSPCPAEASCRDELNGYMCCRPTGAQCDATRQQLPSSTAATDSATNATIAVITTSALPTSAPEAVTAFSGNSDGARHNTAGNNGG